MSSFCLELNQNKLHYYQYGHGSEVILAFHGFDQDHTCFKMFGEVVGRQYTIYALDFFYHGNSVWQQGDFPLDHELWFNIIRMILDKHHITCFSLLGYSLGGKLALITYTHFPDQVKELLLIAPDGIQNNLWQRLATYPYGVRQMFRKTITRPKFFFNLVRILQNLRLISKGWAQFAISQMKNRKKRILVYRTWMVLRKLKLDSKKAINLVNTYQTPLTIFLGKYDRVIKAMPIHNFLKAIHNYQLHVLETGHHDLIYQVSVFYQKQQANEA